jgi:hypothetical protein
LTSTPKPNSMAMPHRRRGTALFMVDGMEDKSVEILRRLHQSTPVVASRVSHSIPATFHNQQIPPRSLSGISIGRPTCGKI